MRLKRIGVLILLVLVGVSAIACGANSPQEDITQQEASSIKKEEIKEKIVIPARDHWWAVDDEKYIYYIVPNKVCRYEKDTGDREYIKRNLSNAYDMAVYKDNIYIVDYVDDENPVRIFKYSDETDAFEEVIVVRDVAGSTGMFVYDHYLIVTVRMTVDEKERRVYDLIDPANPVEIDLEEVEFINEEAELILAEDGHSVLYRGEEITTVDDLACRAIEVWGWNDEYGFICARADENDVFYRFKLTGDHSMEKLGENIRWIEVFDDFFLILFETREVMVERY